MARVIRYLEDGVWKYASVKDVGDLEKLKTVSKADVVSAINELVASGSAMGIELGGRVDGLEGQANELVQITGNVQEVLGQVQGELNDKVEKMYLDEQMNKLVSKEAYDANYQEIKGELLDKVDITKYDAEYNEVTNRLKEKADLSAFNGVEGRVSTTEQEITNVKGELTSKVGKTEYDGAVGLNRWIARKYDINIGSSGATPSFDHIKGKQPSAIVDYDDNVRLQPFTGDYYIGHYFTNIYMKNAKTVTLNVTNDDGAVIYMNGAKMYEGGTRTATLSVPMTFRAGWNTVEILHYEHSGATEHVTLGVKLSTQVDKMTSVIGVGDKNETRLTQAETEIKQTSEAIKLKAEGSIVSELGNRVTTNEGFISVMQNEIKSLVKSEDFNQYTGRLETAESTIIQHSNQINQKVEKKDHDALNDIVSHQQTSINQLTDEIDLKATKSEYDGLNGRVGNAETKINLNTEAIKLKAEKTELDKTNGRLQTAESQLNVQAGQISTKVTQKDIDDSIDNIETMTRMNGLELLDQSYVSDASKLPFLATTGAVKVVASDSVGLSGIKNVLQTTGTTFMKGDLIPYVSNGNPFFIELSVYNKDTTTGKLYAGIEFYDSAKKSLGSNDLTIYAVDQNNTAIPANTWKTFSGYARLGTDSSRDKASYVRIRLLTRWLDGTTKDTTGITFIKDITVKNLGNQNVSNLNTRLSNAETTIVQNSADILLRAKSDEVYKKTEADNKVSTAVSTAKGEIKIETDKISQNVTNLTQTVTSQGTAISNHETSISQMKGSIDLKAEKKDVYTKTESDGKVNTAVTNAKAEIKITTDEINQTVTNVKGDVSGLKDTVTAQGTQIKQTSDEVAINVVKKGSVKASINASTEGVKIGGKHIDITGAVTFQSLDPTMQGKVNAGTDAKNQIDGMQFGGNNIVGKKQITPINVASSAYDEATNTWTLTANSGAGGSWGAGVRITEKTSVVPIGSWFTGSFEIFSPINTTWNVDVNNFPVTGTSTSNDNDDTALRKTSDKNIKANTWTKCWFMWKNKDNSASDLYDQSNIGLINNSGSPVTFKIRNVKGELGNIVTDFSLAQQDIDEAIARVQGNVDNITVGGDNLLLNSHADYSTTDYQIATYTLTENWVAGQEYTFVIKGTVPSGQKFGIWMNGGSTNVGYATTKYVDGVTYVTFKAVTPAGGHTKSLNLYNVPQNTTACTVDWVALYRGNKPMDWQISSGDVQNLFTGADEKAEASKRAIADMSNDNKATSIEKQQLKKEWATITAEKPNYEALATTYGITTEKTNYVNAYNALNTAITPIIANTTVTSDINGATFRATFDDYYDKKSQLIKKINELARSIGTGADSKAQQAKDSIADMSSDSKITPVEKVQLKKEWAVMLSEKPQYEALANTYGITTEKTNFVNAYNTLNTVLNGTGGILTNMTTTSAVTGATFRGQFDDYYDKKAQLVKKINEMSKSLADSAQGTANTANNTANTANNAINSNKATWDRASNINSNGTFNSSKLSGLILDAQISSAVNWNGAKSLLDSWKSGTTLINGGMIATNTIFAQQIAIGDFTNLSQVNEEKNPNGYPTALLNSKRYFKIGNGAYAQITIIANTYVEFKVNDEYYIAFNGYRDAGLTNLSAVFRYYYSDGTWENAGSVSVIPTTADTRIARNLKITTPPNDTKTLTAVNLFFEKDGTAGSGYYYIRDIEVRKRYTGELVVDGSIKAQQLDVASLFAHTAFINSLKSQEISADKIVGGTIKGIRYESINASNKTIKLVLEGNSVKSYGAMDTTAKKQNYAEMKDGGISVFEMAESGSPFGDRKAYVEPARFNAQQGSSYSVALEPTELRFWVPNMTGTISYDVTGNGATGYGLRLESNGGILVKNKSNINEPAIQFEAGESIFIDGWGNFQGGKYSTQYATWSMKDADGRIRMLIPMGKGTQAGNEYHSHAGGHKFFYNGSLGLSTYVQGGDSPIIQFNGKSILKYWGGGNYFEFKNQWDSGFVPVYASAFNTASSLIWKTDIESYEKSALDVVMGTNIVTYKYKSDVEENDNPHTHVGVIAEYAPKEIQSKDGRGVDNYAMSSLAWKAIQELSEQVRYLKEKLNNR
ncbi:tail fiber domain-containing protein [Bacillus cereus]|uniref:tail fiber domain-containing protein n=1 Tax=Bacillus cereus TaxID=1396 RepID=UPI0039809B17